MLNLLFLSVFLFQSNAFIDSLMCDRCCKAREAYEQCKKDRCSKQVVDKEYVPKCNNTKCSNANQLCYNSECRDFQENIENDCNPDVQRINDNLDTKKSEADTGT